MAAVFDECLGVRVVGSLGNESSLSGGIAQFSQSDLSVIASVEPIC